MTANQDEYVGEELPLFALATNWKRYVRSQVIEHLGNMVVEVGAGLGSMTRLFYGLPIQWWLCLEPDKSLAEEIRRAAQMECWGDAYAVQVCDLQGATPPSSPDTILYFDVLEHIEDDSTEIQRAADRLSPGGRVIVLAPAHPFLYSPFDAAIGHYRRYQAARMRSLTPAGLRLVRLRYLDSVGLLASLGNRCLLRQATPSKRQILAWDRLMVPISIRLDWLLCYRVGKSILAVWEKIGPARSTNDD